MESLVDWLRNAPLWQVALAAVAENVVLHGVAIGVGEAAGRRFRHRRVAPAAPDVSQAEVVTASVTLLTNSLTTLAGICLWRMGVLRVRTGIDAWAVIDLPMLLLVMDAGMYLLHRVAHIPWVYPWLHSPHHEYVRPRPLTLFILNPLENVAFGTLILAVLSAYPFHLLAVGIFLGFNIVSGIVGHLGVEPLPDWWARTPLLRCVTGGSFHARHHQDTTANFGFYTLIWDRLCGTLRKDYWDRFGQLPAEADVDGEENGTGHELGAV